MGTLRGARRASETEARLALFLFGSEPVAPLMIVQPVELAVSGSLLSVWDATLAGALSLDLESGVFGPLSMLEGSGRIVALDVAPDGSRYAAVSDRAARVGPDGSAELWYTLASGDLRSGGIVAVGDKLWISNVAAHRIEEFDRASGAPLRSIGRRGHGPLEFGIPRAMARLADGSVAVVDVLNNRVQIISPQGAWIRDLGGPGHSVGTFGRPRDVAGGPDGVVFVTDAFSQRVHAFSTEGEPLLAFGEAGSGPGSLTMPGPIVVTEQPPRQLLSGTRPAEHRYYVLVGELLSRSGVRAYAWLGAEPDGTPELPVREALNWQARSPEMAALNPHWRADGCVTCHTAGDPVAQPIPPESVDALCLSCHDGVRAPADPHPIGRPSKAPGVDTPDAFPTVGGMIGCLTCHDVQRHCSPDARRPVVNAVLLREYDAQRPLDYCNHCHTSEAGARFSPHRQKDASGRVRDDACFFCHTQKMEIPVDGRRRFEPHLRAESSEICLACHTKHWDFSPLGHVQRPVPESMLEYMLVAENRPTTSGDGTPAAPARLPLGDGNVTCYSCHNPHYAGMLSRETELGALARDPRDAKAALRTDWVELCSGCHHQ